MRPLQTYLFREMQARPSAVDFVVRTLALQGNATLTSFASVNPNSILKTVRLVE